MTNENMNYEEMTPDYECDYEEIPEVKPITFKCHITNGFDYIDFETTDFEAAVSHSEALKVHLQGFQQYITKPQPQTQQPAPAPAPQTPPPVQRYAPRQNVAQVVNSVSPKQRAILKQNGYDDASINILNKQQAAQIIKEIFGN